MRWRAADDEDRDDDTDDGSGLVDPDLPEEDDDTVACSNCNHPVYDDAERCPACGHYLSREDAPVRRPWWLVVGVLLGLVVVIRWVMG